MRLSTVSSFLLLPLLAIADTYPADTFSTTTLTSTATLTKTITVSQVVASVTSTYPAYNSTTAAGPTAPTVVGTGSAIVYPTTSIGASSSPSSTIPSNFMGAASSLSPMYAGSAGVLLMIAAALL